MRLKEITIKNFRGYRQETKIPIDPNMTGITGRNDAGKSSILEALDVFFDGGEITLDKDDFNVFDPEGVIEIRCIFDNLPLEIILDETNATTLQAEHLLNNHDELEIMKRYKRSSPSKSEVFIIANHPSEEYYRDLHTLKINDLKKRAKELGVLDADIADGRKSALWRAAIWAKCPLLEKQLSELDVGKFSTDSKTIQDRLNQHLPIFALFKSDRESRDNDPQVKNPMQAAVKQAQDELREDIKKIQDKIQEKVLARAQKTLEKLREMDPSLAAQLIPRFKKQPAWSFDFTIDGEDDIPINKRGSGVRRLILLNFFRAEAERRVQDKNAPSVIYAFEEPETSQHPSNQEMLVRALIQVGQKDTCQVIVTTHVPALAGLLPVEGLRFIEKTDVGIDVRYDSDQVLKEISESLGVLPDPNITSAKALVLVEGASDVVFVRHTAKMLKEAGYLPSALEERGVLPVLIGGCGNLKHWITKRIADQFGIPWGLLLDSDCGTTEEEKNRKVVAQLQSEGKKAHLIRKREPENYILPEVVTSFAQAGCIISYSDEDDAKKIIAEATLRRPDSVLEVFWPKMTGEQIRRSECYVDEEGRERFELTDILNDFLTLV